MRDYRPNPAPAVSPDFAHAPEHDVAHRPGLRLDPPNRHDPLPPEPGTSLPFDGTAERAAHVVGWAAAPGSVGALLGSTANGGVSCTMWVRTANGEQPVPPGKCLFRGADGNFSVVADAVADAALAELRRLCEGVDPLASSV